MARLIASGMVIDFGDATMDDPQPRPLQVMGQVQRLDGGGLWMQMVYIANMA